MPEMNPIVAVALQLLQQKQQEDELVQRKSEAEADTRFRIEQLKQASDQFRLQHDLALARAKMEESKIREEIGSRRFKEFGEEGTRRVEGIETIPQSVPKYQQGVLPRGRELGGIQEALLQKFPALAQMVPYDINQQDTTQPGTSFQPFDTQISESEFGPIFTKGAIPRNELVQRNRAEAWDKAQFDALAKELETRVTEAAKRPNIEAQIAGREKVATINAEQREATAKANRESQERIAGSRNATTIAAARLRAKGAKIQSDEDLNPIVESVYLGETKVPPGNNGIAVTRSVKELGGSVPNKANVDKVPYTRSLLSVADRIEKEIIPLLADTQVAAKGKGVLSKVWNTELANKFAQIELDATTQAREAGEKGNFSNTDIGRALHALGDPGIPKDQGMDRLNTLLNKIYSKLENEYLGGLKDPQKIAILKRFDFDPSSIPAVNDVGRIIKTAQYPKGIPKYVWGEKSQTWGVFDPKLGTYRKVE